MAVVTEDRILETSTSTGTGNMALINAPVGYRRFNAVCAINDTFFGTIVAVDANGLPTGQWECGYYTYGATNTIYRTTVFSSSAGGTTTVDFGAGSKQIFMSFLAYNAKNAGTPTYKSRNIEWYGDARVKGLDGAYTDNRLVGTPMTTTFQNNLPAQPPFTTTNQGVFGNTTTKQLNGTNGTHAVWTTQMANSPASIVLLQYGASDQADGLTSAQYKQNLADLITQARSASKFPIIVTPLPVNNVDLSAYAQAARDQASTSNAPMIDFFAYINSLLQQPANVGPVGFYGGSNFYGENPTPPPNPVSTTIPQEFATKTGLTANNHGVSGTNTDDLINGTNGQTPAWSTRIAQSNETHILLNYGINDWQLDQTQFKNNLNTIINAAKQNNKKVMLVTPQPTNQIKSGGSANSDAEVQNKVQYMKDVGAAQNVPVADLNAFLKQYMTNNNITIDQLVPDGLHLTQAEYIAAGDFIASEFTKAFPSTTTVSLTTLMPDGLHPNQDTYDKLGKYAASVFPNLPLPAPVTQ